MNHTKRNLVLFGTGLVLIVTFALIDIWRLDYRASGSPGDQMGVTPTTVIGPSPLGLQGIYSFFFPYISGILKPSQTLTATVIGPHTATSTVPNGSPSQTHTPSKTPTNTLPFTSTSTQAFSTSATPTLTSVPGTILESFEGALNTWQIMTLMGGSGTVSQSNDHPAAGNSSARLVTSGSGSSASIGALNLLDRAGDHIWGERPGKWFWQRASVYLPSQTITALNTTGYLDLAGFWPSSGGSYGWWLRVRQDKNGKAALYIYGYDLLGNPAEFNIYGQFPTDQWVDFTFGLNSQSGPGVKRAFAVLINGNFYGWYHQGHMDSETYNRAAIGINHTNAAASLSVYVDQWYAPQTQSFPVGPDLRSNANLQNHDFRNQNGIQWQIDWSTWKNNLVLDPAFGLYSTTYRLQSGHNLDRMPDLTNGWAQIEIDWPKGTLPGNASLNGAFAGLVGFHKEINREQNLEVSPMIVNGTARLIYDAWTGGENDLASWTLPKATTLNDGRNLPEPGDLIRIRWEQVNSNQINLRASFYDASTHTWYNNVINDTHDLSSVGSQDSSFPGQVNFLDGYHTASSITIDTPFYSIRNYTVGVLGTYPGP